MRRALGLLLLALVVLGAAPADQPVAVIVNPKRAARLGRGEVAAIFLRKRRFWDDGAPIVPLNREAGSALREAFSRRVLGTDADRIGAYWNEQYFQGIFPPAVVASAAAMKRYVATDPNAIGYVEPGEVDDSVRVAFTAP